MGTLLNHPLSAPAAFATAFYRFVLRGNFNKTLYYVSRPLYGGPVSELRGHLCQMESPVASVKTCTRPDIDAHELEMTWDFEPKGIKLVL